MAEFVHAVLMQFFSQHMPNILEKAGMKAMRTGGGGWGGINGLARRLWHGPGDAFGPASNLQTVPSAPPLVTVGLGDGIVFTIAAVLPLPRMHFHTYAHMFPHSQGARSGPRKKKKKRSPKLPVVVFISVGCVSSLMNRTSLLAAFVSLSELHPGEE